MKALKRFLRIFDGTKECHAKMDAAVTRSVEVRKRDEKVVEKKMAESQSIS